MINQIKEIVRKNYTFFEKSVSILQRYPNPTFLHDKKRLELIGDSNEKTYVGEMNCGAACYVMNYILKKDDIHTQMILNGPLSRGRKTKYQDIHDHCILKCGDIIIDPTYKQFFNFKSLEANDIYNEYLFENNDYTFVGTSADLKNKFQVFENIYQIFHDEKFVFNKTNLKLWNLDGKDISFQCDLHKIENNLNYAKKKEKNTTIYSELHNFLNFL